MSPRASTRQPARSVRRRSSSGIWTMAARNIGRRPRRSLLSALAIGLATLAMVVMLSLVAGIKADMAQTIKRYHTGDILIQHKDFQRGGARHANQVVDDADRLAADLGSGGRRVAGIASISARILGGASVFVGGEAVIFPFIGLEAARDPMALAGLLMPGGRLPAPGSRDAVISQALAARLGLTPGARLTAITQTQRGSSNGMSFTVSGLLSPAAGQFNGLWLFLDIETARRFVRLEHGATGLLVSLDGTRDAARVLDDIRTRLPPDSPLAAEPWNRTSTTYRLIAIADLAYNFMGIFFFVLASTVMINTMLMIVLERSREIGTLAALGMDRPVIRRLFLAESLILSSAGAGLGCLAGCLVTLLLGRTGLDFSQAMQGMAMELSPVMRPHLEPQIPLIVFLTATLVSTAFTALPVRRIGRMDIVAALRGD